MKEQSPRIPYPMMKIVTQKMLVGQGLDNLGTIAGGSERYPIGGLAQTFPMHKAGALPFWRSVREGGAF